MKKMTKASQNRLIKSEFFHEVRDVVKAWDYYLSIGDRKAADEMMYKWQIAKLALEHITGNLYSFFRDKCGTYFIFNECDHSDKIIFGRNEYKKEAMPEQAVNAGVAATLLTNG
jgi:hypothetical protein